MDIMSTFFYVGCRIMSCFEVTCIEGGIRSRPSPVAGSANQSPVWIGLRSPSPPEFLIEDGSIFPGAERNRSICRPDQRVNSGEGLIERTKWHERGWTEAIQADVSLPTARKKQFFFLTWPPIEFGQFTRGGEEIWSINSHISRIEDKINETGLYPYICPTRTWNFLPLRIKQTKLQTICQQLHLVRPEPTSFEL